MSHETKFGLLAMLGFIVCFVVLLLPKVSSPLLTQNLPLTAVNSPSPDQPRGYPYSPPQKSEKVRVAPGPLPGTSADLELDNDLPGEASSGWHAPTSQPATRPTAPDSSVPPQTRLVRRGDNLWKIAGEVYGRSSPDVISYIAEANKDTIKDCDSLREGQTILIPALPADMPGRWSDRDCPYGSNKHRLPERRFR